jgi:large subunit ribosomal protein L19
MARQLILESINASNLKTDVPVMDIGDTVSVQFRIVEGDKERLQAFTGVIISRHGRGIDEIMTLRKVVDDVGVERVFPINSPVVAGFEVLRRADARRAKLYYLRDRQGKSQRLRDRRRGLKHVTKVDGKA